MTDNTADDLADDHSENHLPASLDGHPPSSVLVYRTLAEHGPCSWTEIADRCGMPTSTVTNALNRLRDEDLLDEYPNPTDPSHRLYDAGPSSTSDIRK